MKLIFLFFLIISAAPAMELSVVRLSNGLIAISFNNRKVTVSPKEFAENYPGPYIKLPYNSKTYIYQKDDQKLIATSQYAHQKNDDWEDFIEACSMPDSTQPIRCGFIDNKDNILIDLKFNSVRRVNKSNAVVTLDQKTHILNITNKKLSPVACDELFVASENLFFCKQDGTYSAYRNMAKTKHTYQDVWVCTEGLCPVKVGGVWGYVDYDLNIVIKPQYVYRNHNFNLSFQNGIAKVPVGDSGYHALIDKKGNRVSDKHFTKFLGFSDGVACACLQESCGFLNLDFEYSIKPQYSDCENFSGGFAPVQDPANGLYKYIDLKGEMRLPPVYFYARSFHEHVATVFFGWHRYNVVKVYINEKGENLHAEIEWRP